MTEPVMTGLVERLRTCPPKQPDEEFAELLVAERFEAANRIEADAVALASKAAEIERLTRERDELRQALSHAARMNANTVDVLKWARDEVFGLCEATLDSSPGDSEFERGRRHEAKGISRAIGDVILDKIRRLDDLINEAKEITGISAAEASLAALTKPRGLNDGRNENTRPPSPVQAAREALEGIAALKGHTLIDGLPGSSEGLAYSRGANDAFEQAADLASAALSQLGEAG